MPLARRDALRAAALGVTSLGLPPAAAAASSLAFIPDASQQRATGGDTIEGFTIDGIDYVVHTFTSDGTFTPDEDLTVEYVVVAGGGGGGGGSDRNRGAGGGGAGGLRSSVAGDPSGGGGAAEAPLALTSGTAYTITVGTGGAGGTGTPADRYHTPDKGRNGTDSSIVGTAVSVVALGGGGGAGGRYLNNTVLGDGLSGGSGGGAGNDEFVAGQGAVGGAGTEAQGYGGGDAAIDAGGGGGGGGGAGGPGGNGTANFNGWDGGASGAGLASNIVRPSLLLAVGGPGGDHTGTFGTDPRPTTSSAPGSGGAGRDGNSRTQDGDVGVDGIVILRYAVD